MNIPPIASELEEGILEEVKSSHMGDTFRKAMRKKDVAPQHIGNDSFSEITERLSKDDIEDQTEMYRNLLDLETESMAEQMTHRANLMRQRADEFDEIAAGLRLHRDKLSKSSTDFLESRKHVLELIHRHAFIQPQKVTNNG